VARLMEKIAHSGCPQAPPPGDINRRPWARSATRAGAASPATPPLIVADRRRHRGG
jgi:hypothetical protein